MTEFEACNQAPDNSRDVVESKSSITRRNLLKTFAATAASFGLVGLASSAEAASKKYKVCATKDVKIGGGSIFRVSSANGLMVLITQPSKGTFRAFNPACTHEGFPLNQIEGKNLLCTRHSALFDMNTGNVARGPARTPLKKYVLTKEGSNLFITITS